jgi:hypothetical protein
MKSAQELLKEKIEKVRKEDEKERQLDPEKEHQWALLRKTLNKLSHKMDLAFDVMYG